MPVSTDAETLPRTQAAEGASSQVHEGSCLDGRYTLVSHIAEGGMADIWLARHKLMGKEVAVKILKPEYTSDPIIRERFIREARALSRVTHENVVAVTDVGSTPENLAFMVMELLVGESLENTILREEPLPWGRSKVIILQVCRALHAAHQRGIIHRDIKPENCWRMKRGANPDFIKLLDFGIAKMHPQPGEPLEKLTKTGDVFGTPFYMSPEQALGRSADERSDVYSVGIMLYRMVTGTLPFTGSTAQDVLGKQIYELPIPPSERSPDCSPALEKALLRALAKSPEERFSSIRALAEALSAIPSDTHMTQTPATATAKYSQSHVKLAVVLVALCAVVVTCLLY